MKFQKGTIMSAAHPLDAIALNIKVTAQVSPEPTDDDLAFVRQMGVEYVVSWTDAEHASYEYYAQCRKRFESAGLKLYGLGNRDVHNQEAIVLNLPGRDEKIEEYKRHLRNLGKAGIPYTTYAHMGNGIWSTEPEQTRGGARARGFDLSKATAGHWFKQEYPMPLSHGREYSQQEIWDNYEYFIRQAAPVKKGGHGRAGIGADESGVERPSRLHKPCQRRAAVRKQQRIRLGRRRFVHQRVASRRQLAAKALERPW